MSGFGKNDSRRLSNFLQTHIFGKFNHISRTYDQISYRNIWFAKVIIILIMMTQAIFLNIFFEKDTTKTTTLGTTKILYILIDHNMWLSLSLIYHFRSSFMYLEMYEQSHWKSGLTSDFCSTVEKLILDFSILFL